MIRARDVIFDEDHIFDGNLEKLRADCLDIDLDDLSALLTQLDVSQRHENDPYSDDLRKPSTLPDDECDECILVGNPGALDETVSEPDEGQDLMQLAQQALDAIEQGPSEPSFSVEFTKGQQPYPTPPQSPPAALLAETIQGPKSSDLPEMLEVWKAALNAGQMRQHIGHLDGNIFLIAINSSASCESSVE